MLEAIALRVAAILVLVAVAGPAAAGASRFDLPEGPGRGLIYGQCQTCHDLQSLVDSAGIGRGAWNAVLDNMRGFGLRVDANQRAKILDYLATYLGPNPPAPAPDTSEAAPDDGARVFLDVCSACHQEDGAGKANEFPPLAGNRDLFLAPRFPAQVVVHGIAGPLAVGDRRFDNVMPPFDFLTDAEIAAVINHVRAQWGNGALAGGEAPVLTAADVAAVRAEPMTAEEVHALRQSLLP